MTQFGTGEIGLPVHHPPVNQPGTTMVSGDPATEELLGLPQSHLPREWAHVCPHFLYIVTCIPFLFFMKK